MLCTLEFVRSQTKSKSTTHMHFLDSRLGLASGITYTSKITLLSSSDLQINMHLLSISKNWKGQSLIWIPSSSGLSFVHVFLNTLANSNQFWISIGINKGEQFQLQRKCQLGLWLKTSLEPCTLSRNWYHSSKCLLLVLAPSFALAMLPKRCEKSQQEFKPLPKYQAINKLQVGKGKAWDGCT